MQRLISPCLLALLLLVSASARAHKASDAYLFLSPSAEAPARATLRIDVALRDLAPVVDLDHDADGQVTWAEILASRGEIETLIKRDVGWPGCVLTGRALEAARRSDGVYAVTTFGVSCSDQIAPRVSALRYELFAEEDPTHRAIVRNELDSGQPLLLLVSPRRSTASSNTAAAREPLGDGGVEQGTGRTDTFIPTGFITEGIAHILGGLDHVLFLLCLLLPAVGRRDGHPSNVWAPHARPAQALWPVVGLITMFTLAHSVTLALATLGWVPVSPNIVEPLIAATIVATAIDNVRPFFRIHRAVITFAFGLVHGLGFAGSLAEMGGLPPSALAWALLQFNVGIELGQFAIVVVVLTLLTALSRFRAQDDWYRRWPLRTGSALVGGLGTWWLVDRLRWLADLAA